MNQFNTDMKKFHIDIKVLLYRYRYRYIFYIYLFLLSFDANIPLSLYLYQSIYWIAKRTNKQGDLSIDIAKYVEERNREIDTDSTHIEYDVEQNSNVTLIRVSREDEEDDIQPYDIYLLFIIYLLYINTST